jgi:hypothetical protein
MISLSYAQHRLWFGSWVDPLGWTFNLRLEGDLDQAALTAAVADVVSGHECSGSAGSPAPVLQG